MAGNPPRTKCNSILNMSLHELENPAGRLLRNNVRSTADVCRTGYEFELITYWDGFEATFGVDYAEHARIGGHRVCSSVGDARRNPDNCSPSHYCVPDVGPGDCEQP